MLDAYHAARDWLEEIGCDVVYERGQFLLVGRLRPERRFKPGTRIPYERVETAAVIVDSTTLATGMAQARLNTAFRWRSRSPSSRWIAVVVPREVPDAELLACRGFDQCVRWPKAFYPHETGETAVSSGLA